MTRKVLDAWAVMAWLQGEPPAHARVSAIFDAASQHRADVSISMINVGEIFYSLAKRRGVPAAEEFLADMSTFPVSVVVPGRRQILEAARLKARFAISYADAFAMQTALEANAALVTGDEEIRDVAHEVDLRLDWVAALPKSRR